MSTRFDLDVRDVLDLLELADDQVYMLRQVDYLAKVERRAYRGVHKLLLIARKKVAQLVPSVDVPTDHLYQFSPTLLITLIKYARRGYRTGVFNTLLKVGYTVAEISPLLGNDWQDGFEEPTNTEGDEPL